MGKEQKILEELIGSKPEKLTGEAKKIFEAIMKIADERDELLKERQADKEKIKKLEEEIDDWKFTKNYVEDNYIHKNEIKRKIEEVKQWELYNMKIPKLSTLDERLGAKIGIEYVLQSLLEKK